MWGGPVQDGCGVGGMQGVCGLELPRGPDPVRLRGQLGRHVRRGRGGEHGRGAALHESIV